MSIRIKNKSYGPLTVAARADGSMVSKAEGGHCVDVGLAPGADCSSPSDLLLGALASCIYISLGMAATSLNLSISDLTVHVTAEKAHTLPHRIDQFNVLVNFKFDGTSDDRDRILKATRQLCTVSNTLDADIVLHYAVPTSGDSKSV